MVGKSNQKEERKAAAVDHVRLPRITPQIHATVVVNAVKKAGALRPYDVRPALTAVYHCLSSLPRNRPSKFGRTAGPCCPIVLS